MKFLSVCLLLFLSVVAKAQSTTSNFDLRDCLLYANDNSPAKKQLRLSREKNRMRWELERSKNLPQISAYADYSHFFELPTYIFPAAEGSILSSGDSNGPYPIQLGRPNNLFAGARLSQVLFDKRWLATNDFKALDSEIAQLSEYLVEEEMIERVAVTFFELQKLKSKHISLEESIERLNKTREILELQSQNQMINKTEVSRVELMIRKMEAEQTKLAGVIKSRTGQLKFQMGMPLESQVSFENYTDDLELTLQGPDSTNSVRMDLLEKQEQMGILSGDAVSNSYFPQVRAFADFQFQAQRNSLNFISDQKWFPRHVVGVGVNVPIFTGFEKKVKVQQEEIKVDEVRLNKEMVESEEKLQLQYASDHLESAQLFLLNSEEQKELATTILNQVQLQYQEGVSSLRELLTAEQDQADINNQYEEAIFDYKLAQISYLKSSNRLRVLLQ